MADIVNFGDLKEKKNKKETVKKQLTQSQPASTYFVMLGNGDLGQTKLSFGGAFVRDFISRMKEQKSDLVQKVTGTHELILDRFRKEENAEEYVNLYLGKQTLVGIIDLMLDQFTFDTLFDDSKFAQQAGMVIGIAIFSYYTLDDLEEMQEQSWINCDLDEVKDLFEKIESE